MLTPPVSVRRPAPAPKLVPHVEESNTKLPEGEAKVLRVVIQYGTVDKTSISTITGYKRQTRDAYLSRLATRGFVENGRGDATITDAGRAALPGAEPLPTGEKLREFWRNKLPAGECKIFEVLVAAYPNTVTKDDIDSQTGFKRQTRDAYLSRLSSRKVIENGRGEAKASPTLF